MAVKFKVGFTMSAEALFAIIAKVLPIEDLQVEEIEPPRQISKIAAQVARLAAPTKPKRPKVRRGNRHTGMRLDSGGNAIVMTLLSDGKPHVARELKPLFEAAGFSAAGIGSRLDKLRNSGAVHQPRFGFWQIGEAKKAASA